MKVRPIVLAIIAVVVAVDQLTKAWAVAELADGRTISIFPTLELDLSFNSGFSFSTGTGYGQLIGAAVIGICVYLARLMARQASARRANLLAVILAGALGNLCDRVFRASDGILSGQVVDFIDVSWFAVFNVADICVVGGTVLLAATEILTREPADGRSFAG